MQPRNKSHRPILVTGSHRSGTTWTGNIISASPDICYIHEPFNKDYCLNYNPTPFPFWYYHISKENDALNRRILHDILNYRYSLIQAIGNIHNLRELFKAVYGKSLSLLNGFSRKRPLLKDPIAFFSAEWLHTTFDMDIVVTIRHPCAFASSLKLKAWEFDFNEFLGQPVLMQNLLSDYRLQIEEFADGDKDIIDQSILLWNCIHSVIHEYEKRHSDWVFVRHEDLSLDPVGQFEIIYDRLGLEFRRQIRQKILASSGSGNPTEQVPGQEFLRNSRKNITIWKQRLNASEIERIRNGTGSVAGHFYRESDW